MRGWWVEPRRSETNQARTYVDSLQTEAVLATIGLESILRGEPRYTVAMSEEASGLPRKIKTNLNAFLTDKEFDKVEPLSPFNFDEVNALLSKAGTVDQIEALQKAIGDPELASAVEDAATRAIEWLHSQFPRRVITTLLGDEVLPPTPAELKRFARAWRVVNDPTIVLRDLRNESLSRDMVEALIAVYPTLHREIQLAANERAIAQQAKRKTPLRLPRVRERLLAMLLQKEDFSTLAQIQAVYAQTTQAPQQPQQLRPAKFDTDTKALQTPAQQIAS